MIRLSPAGSGDFSRFGRWIVPPAEAGTRLDLTDILTPLDPGTVARAHVNHVRPATLPMSVAALEHHPRAWQAFMPLDVAEYVVIVAGRRGDGQPDPADLHAFRVPGTVGVAYAPGVWHMGATVLHRVGHFTVLWPREPSGPDGGPGDTIVTRLDAAVTVGEA
ncbi:ureidoglycolate lyase [Alsobacter sp. R-9]